MRPHARRQVATRRADKIKKIKHFPRHTGFLPTLVGGGQTNNPRRESRTGGLVLQNRPATLRRGCMAGAAPGAKSARGLYSMGKRQGPWGPEQIPVAQERADWGGPTPGGG